MGFRLGRKRTAIVTAWRQIAADSLLDNVDTPFRVRAGPGAGKTWWLLLHIENVLKRSMRLTAVSRIACISYTNVAAEEIVKRLGPAADRVEVSTIHSFLYRNVVKPYLRLLRNEDGTSLVNYALVEGHDEHRPSYRQVEEWLGGIGQKWILKTKQDRAELWRKLGKCRWMHNPRTGEWQLQLPSNVRPRLPAKVDQGLATYKAYYWKYGIIDHDDVLFLSHRILKENPVLVIDGCGEKCCEKVVNEAKGQIRAIINVEDILTFFGTEPGKLVLQNPKQTLREWPFTLALDARRLGAQNSEPVVVQGIVDLITPARNGLAVVDFKTGHPGGPGRDERIGQYGRQLAFYCEAVEAILGKPVTCAWLYLTSTREIMAVNPQNLQGHRQ